MTGLLTMRKVRMLQVSSRLLSWSTLGLLSAMLSYTSPTLAQDATRMVTSPLERPVLQLGARGEGVSELQATLKLLGFYAGPVDGVYSELTAQAVSAFQELAGLSPDGVAGANTWIRLFPATPMPVAASPATALACTPTATPATSETEVVATAVLSSESQIAEDLPILKIGMQGEAVMNLQERLQARGFFQGTVDGIFGKQTQAAVKAAQEQLQLQPDGVVGPATWDALSR